MRNSDIQIERWPLDRLIPSDVNPRTHTPAQVAQIAASIQEFGFVNPILVGADGRIIAGEGRYRAILTLGMREVSVIVVEHLSEIQRRALTIADIQLALNASWDEQMLREQLAALRDQDFNLDLLGFDDQELARQLANQDASGLTDEDEVPAIPMAPVTRPCDLWLLGSRKKLQPAKNPDDRPMVGSGFNGDHDSPNVTYYISGQNVTMPFLAAKLAVFVHRPVTDKTGLRGSFDFKFDYAEGNDDVFLFAALQKELGLKLESKKGPIEILVIDHAEKPSAN